MSNDIQPTEPQAANLPAVVPDDEKFLQEWTDSRLPMRATFDPYSPQGRDLTVECWSTTDLNLAHVQNQVISVKQIAVLRQLGKVGDDGEVAMKWKVCLVLDDNRVIKFASGSAIDSIRAIIATHGGMEKIQLPIRLMVVMHKIGTPEAYPTLRPAREGE
jgi:hypothetical protein